MISKTKQLFYIAVLALSAILSSFSKLVIDDDKVYFVYWNKGNTISEVNR